MTHEAGVREAQEVYFRAQGWVPRAEYEAMELACANLYRVTWEWADWQQGILTEVRELAAWVRKQPPSANVNAVVCKRLAGLGAFKEKMSE